MLNLIYNSFQTALDMLDTMLTGLGSVHSMLFPLSYSSLLTGPRQDVRFPPKYQNCMVQAIFHFGKTIDLLSD